MLMIVSMCGAVVLGIVIALSYLSWKDSRPVKVPEVLSRLVETEHLLIHTDLTESEAKHYARFFDGFYEYFSKEYFPLQQEKPLVMLLFGEPRDYEKFCIENGTLNTPFGFYMGPRKNTIVVNLRKGLGTATHELVHHFLALGKMDYHADWVNEGIPAFFEKFMARVEDDGTVHMSFGYFSNWRFPFTKFHIEDITLEDLFESDEQSYARAFTLFLHRNNHLSKFVQRLHAGGKQVDPKVALAEVCGKSLAELEREWKEWVTSQPIDENVKLVPAAFAKTQSEWSAWWQENRERLVWDEDRFRYVARNAESSIETAPARAPKIP